MTEDEKVKIRKEAKDVIANADAAREGLLIWINQGSGDLASKAYAIKSRVKDENSLVRKVMYKIEQDKKSRYTAYSATDIIGLRLLALNNDRLPMLVEAFVTFVTSCQARNLNLFVGKFAHETIEEIKLYRSKNNLSVYDEIRAHLLSRGLQDKNGKPRIELSDSTDEDPYSSIHFVCRIADPKTSKPFPLEVQIRTVFEDAWAEIEHPLRYKGTSYYDEQQSSEYVYLKQIADAFLKGLKQNLDYCLTITDDIQNLYTGIERLFAKRVTAFAVKFTPFGGHLDSKAILDSSRTPAPIFKSVSDNVDGEIELILGLLLEENYVVADEKIDEVLRRLDQISERYKATHSAKFFHDLDYSFYYKMEKAFLLLLKQKIRSSSDLSVLDKQEYGNKALDIYLELDRDSRFAKQALLKFRLATAAKVANKTEIAQTALHEADRLLKTDRTIPPDHILRVTIPRQYSLMLWLRKQEIWFSGNQKGEPRFRSSDQIQILRRCLGKTRECMIEMKRIQPSAEKAIEEMRLFNNQISYVWELKDLGERADLSAQEKCAIKKYLPNLDAELVQPEGHGFTRRMSGIDSALKASTLLGDVERIEKYRMLMLDSLKREKESPPEQREFTADELGFFEYSLGRLGAVAKGKAKRKARSA